MDRVDKYNDNALHSLRLSKSRMNPKTSVHPGGGLQCFGPLTIQNSTGHFNLGTDHGTSSTQDQTPSGFGATLGDLHFAGHRLGEISPYNGLPLFQFSGRSWIQSRTGLDVLKLSSPPWHNHHVQSAILSPISDLELPARTTTDHYFSMYRRGDVRLAFPVVDVLLFENTIDLAYCTRTDVGSTECTTARACVYSFLAVLSLIEGSIEEAPIDSHACAAKAQYALPQLLTESSLVTLQICYMQVC